MIPPMMLSSTPSALRQVQCRHQLPLTLGGRGPVDRLARRSAPGATPAAGGTGGTGDPGGTGSQGPVLPGASGVPSSGPTCWALAVRAWLPPRPFSGRGAVACLRRYPAGWSRDGRNSRPPGGGSPGCPSRCRRSPSRSRPSRRRRRDHRRRSPRLHRPPPASTTVPPVAIPNVKVISFAAHASSLVARRPRLFAGKRPLPDGGSGHPSTRRTHTLPPGSGVHWLVRARRLRRTAGSPVPRTYEEARWFHPQL